MMYRIFRTDTIKWTLPFIVVTFLIFLSRTQLVDTESEALSYGILLDLLITVPLLYYLAIRNTKVPKVTILYCLGICLLLAKWLLPENEQNLVSVIQPVIIMIIELGVILFIVQHIINLSQYYRESDTPDFYDKLCVATSKVLPQRFSYVFATEIAVFYYLFKINREISDSDFTYTYHRKSGIRTVIGVLMMLIVFETVALHLLISTWSVRVAWILSILGVYTLLQVASILRSMSQRLIEVNNNRKVLRLRYGFGSQTEIPFDLIEKIEMSRSANSSNRQLIYLSVFGKLDSINLILHLKDENTLFKLYGLKKKYKSIAIFVDDRDRFTSHIETILQDT